ncbi:STAS/SEC14 domain-containing protein [Pseudoalteromonas sp. AOP31-A2-14]|uniref:STAS/SEC14 domain-containing protein n=1 Tax=Pseudoalteromonas sp. AOP31-A2-14 TaxID=3457695 RepID=UPI003FB8F54F
MSNHGLTIGLERTSHNFYLTLKVVGKLTHADYLQLAPMIDGALNSAPDAIMNIFVDASELQGFQAQAAWDDLKLSLKHNNNFSKIALLGNAKWQKIAAKVGNWFTTGELKYFEDRQVALEWLHR